MSKNVSYTGGFIGMLASLAALAIPLAAHVPPPILSGLTTGLLSGGINEAISSSGEETSVMYKAEYPTFLLPV